MWQVSQACGERASCTEKVCRVWHESQEAVPKRSCFCNAASCSGDLMPILWQEPQPFMPSVMAIGCQWMVGIASMAAQAIECFPFLNCATCVS